MVIGSLQHHFNDYIHDVPKEHKKRDGLSQGLIYDCLVCHSTIMMRKKAFIDVMIYFYDNN